MSVLAIVPAKSRSTGIPGKNLKPLAGRSPMNRAIDVCNALYDTLDDYVVSSDVDWAANERVFGDAPARRYGQWLKRPVELAQDDTPMIDVVKHALGEIPGPPDQIIVLLPPTQPLREPKHITEALRMLSGGMDYDSVVSITPIPRTHAPDFVMMYCDTTLTMSPYTRSWEDWRRTPPPQRRQDVPWPYVRDGTVYAFFRKTVATYGDIYGELVGPLVIPPEETCALDTEADWREAERRLSEREAAHRREPRGAW